MITHFYADNYFYADNSKCLQNFENKPETFELVVGANGTPTVFEALDKVQRFIEGDCAGGDLLADLLERNEMTQGV